MDVEPFFFLWFNFSVHPISETFSIKITLGALISVLVVVIGFASWMTLMQSTADANSSAITEIKEHEQGLKDILIAIDQRLIRIEVLLQQKESK